MNRRFVSAMLVAAGVLLGYAASSYRGADLCLPAARAADVEVPPDREVAAQLKEINAQLKDINTLLHKGAIKTIVLINPDAG